MTTAKVTIEVTLSSFHGPVPTSPETLTFLADALREELLSIQPRMGNFDWKVDEVTYVEDEAFTREFKQDERIAALEVALSGQHTGRTR